MLPRRLVPWLVLGWFLVGFWLVSWSVHGWFIVAFMVGLWLVSSWLVRGSFMVGLPSCDASS